jgi:hypothetical protein
MNESPDLDAMRQPERVASASPHEDRVAKDQNPSRAIPLPPLSALKENDPDAWNELVRKLFPAALAAAKTKLRGDYAEDARDIALGAVNSLVYKVVTVRKHRRASAPSSGHHVQGGGEFHARRLGGKAWRR